MPDNDGMSDFLLDTRDLQIRVDNPQKHLSTLETYITFRITTRTSRAEFDETEYVVRRRYNDFLWLREKLVHAYPNNLIPPLPEKHSLIGQLDRYSKDFILCRMALLHRFMNRVADHPVLSCNPSFKLFVTAKPSEFSIHRKSKQGLLGRWTDSLQNLAAVYLSKGRPPDFDQTLNYVQALSDKLANIEKISHRVNKEQQEHLSEVQHLQPIFTLWAASEPELSPALLAISSALEKVGAAEQTLVKGFPQHVNQPLKEFLLYIDAVKEALNRRDATQIEFELTLESEQHNTMHQPQSGGFTSLFRSTVESRDDKITKLSSAIPELVKQVEDHQDKTECANESLRADLERWNLEKKRDLKQLFLALANDQIKYYEQSLAAWEEALPEMREQEQCPVSELHS
ncbi:hypothetical protein B566_EDAN009709 [Ephemera danica]|nr:hypothetical protein B566_EDAN009709 [Ephemera danica]